MGHAVLLLYNNRTIRMSSEPSRLIVRYLSNEATPEEQEELLDWVSTSAENQKIFQQYALAWNKEEMRIPTINEERALQSFNSRIDTIEQETEKRMRPMWLKIAAAITVMLVSSAAIWKIFETGSKVEYAEARTMAGQRTTIQLSDGSVIRLNASSTLRYPIDFKGKIREVFLNGEAFFDVRPNERVPFVVQADGVAAEVLGTTFNVNADSAHVAVTVATGKVKVSNETENEVLLPRDQVRVLRRSGEMQRSQVDLDIALAWTQNILVFDNTALGDVALMLTDWYGVRISLGNSDVAKCRITGRYRNEDLAHILEAIRFSTGAEFRANSDGTIILSGRGCN